MTVQLREFHHESVQVLPHLEQITTRSMSGWLQGFIFVFPDFYSGIPLVLYDDLYIDLYTIKIFWQKKTSLFAATEYQIKALTLDHNVRMFVPLSARPQCEPWLRLSAFPQQRSHPARPAARPPAPPSSLAPSPASARPAPPATSAAPHSAPL